MKVVIEIDCNNAAFADSGELSRILKELSRKLDDISIDEINSLSDIGIFDFNGNRVGQLTVKE